MRPPKANLHSLATLCSARGLMGNMGGAPEPPQDDESSKWLL